MKKVKFRLYFISLRSLSYIWKIRLKNIVKIFGNIQLEITDEANAMKQIKEEIYPNILKNGDDVNKNYGCFVIILMCNIFLMFSI